MLLGQEVHLVKDNDASFANRVVKTVLLVVTAIGGGGDEIQHVGLVKTNSPLEVVNVWGLITERVMLDPHARYSVKGAEPLLVKTSNAALYVAQPVCVAVQPVVPSGGDRSQLLLQLLQSNPP
jgi:hypothetical protein